MKILVADDHPRYREAVRVQIERLFDGVAVFEVPSLEEASALASGPEAPFDLFLIDFGMPGMSLAALSQLTRSHPDVPIAVISGTADAGDVRATIQAGARGYILKSAMREELLQAIREVFEGRRYVDAAVAPLLAARTQHRSLTSRELEVLRMVAKGLGNKAIAASLNIAEVTVKTITPT